MTTEIRKAALDAVLERIHLEGYEDYDRFARKAANWFAKHHPDELDESVFIDEFRTDENYFQYNQINDREAFLRLVFSDALNAIDVAPSSEPNQLWVEDIDSFDQVRNVNVKDINVDLPLDIPEAEVKRCIREIIDEPFDQRDWGGEINDLFTSRVELKNKRIDTAFMLKGPSVSGEMYISDAGTRGDQLQRLFDSPAQLYVVQFNGPFNDRTIRQIKREAQLVGADMFCIIDGADTARLLQAYKKI